MLAGARLRSWIEFEPTVTIVLPAGAGGDLDGGGGRRSRDAKFADFQQVLVAHRAGVGGEVGDGILAKSRQELEDVVARPATQRVIPGAVAQRVVAHTTDEAVDKRVAGQRQTGRPRARAQELDLPSPP